METTLEQRQQRYANFNLTAQPIPVIIGDVLGIIDSSYVCFNSIRYKVDTPIKAVDTCFKMYHALQAEYPKECDSTWMFIQTYIFKIKTPHDRKYVSVASIISDLELNK